MSERDARDPDVVRRTAELARLRLTDDEVAEFQSQFTGILDFLSQLAGVETEGVEPLAHPLPLADVLRDDVVEEGLGHEAALEAAPDAVDGSFRVPRVLADTGNGDAA